MGVFRPACRRFPATGEIFCARPCGIIYVEPRSAHLAPFNAIIALGGLE